MGRLKHIAWIRFWVELPLGFVWGKKGTTKKAWCTPPGYILRFWNLYNLEVGARDVFTHVSPPRSKSLRATRRVLRPITEPQRELQTARDTLDHFGVSRPCLVLSRASMGRKGDNRRLIVCCHLVQIKLTVGIIKIHKIPLKNRVGRFPCRLRRKILTVALSSNSWGAQNRRFRSGNLTRRLLQEIEKVRALHISALKHHPKKKIH